MKWLDDGCRLRTSCSSSRDWFMRMDSGGGYVSWAIGESV